MLPAAAALMAGSVALNQRAKKNERKDRSRYMAAERGRQSGYQQQADEIMGQQLDAIAAPENQQAAVEQRLVDAYTPKDDGLSSSYVVDGSGAPTQVTSEIARRMMDGIMKGKMAARAKARLGSFGLSQQLGAMDINRGAQELGRVQNFSQGSYNVLPYEFEQANVNQYGTRAAADLAGSLGHMFMLYGLTRQPDAGVLPEEDIDQMIGWHREMR